jgi:hypothetical protein
MTQDEKFQEERKAGLDDPDILIEARRIGLMMKYKGGEEYDTAD